VLVSSYTVLSVVHFVDSIPSARRFLRLHKWIDNFNAAATAMSSSKSGVAKLLETAKFTFLGLYFLMEMFTITDVMGLTKLSLGGWLVVEGNRMWFYGLILGILQAIWEGLFVVEQQKLVSVKGGKGKKNSDEKTVVSSAPRRKGLPYKQLLIDSCDLFIPGAVIQVIPFSPLVVGMAMAVSTLLQISDLWLKIQAQAISAKK
jgi:hypothetical protein